MSILFMYKYLVHFQVLWTIIYVEFGDHDVIWILYLATLLKKLDTWHHLVVDPNQYEAADIASPLEAAEWKSWSVKLLWRDDWQG